MTEPLQFKVEDMTCAHCAAAISRAIRKDSPLAKVTADPVSKLVTVAGGKDLATVRSRIEAAGFTPKQV